MYIYIYIYVYLSVCVCVRAPSLSGDARSVRLCFCLMGPSGFTVWFTREKTELLSFTCHCG